MVWFWSYDHFNDTLPFAEFRRVNVEGEITSSKIVNFAGRLQEREDSPFFELRGPNKKLIEKICSLPTSTLCPLVDETVQAVLRENVPEAEIQFTKANILWGDKILTNFTFARPLIVSECIDLEQSIINFWDLQDDLFSTYEKLVLNEERISATHYTRTKFFREVLISDDLKKELERVNDSTMIFVRPEDMKPWHLVR